MSYWQESAACLGMDLRLFFELYESDLDVAWTVDATCAGCPVIESCYRYGVNTKADGVWGGMYMINGEIDARRNAHKTREQWQFMKNTLDIEIDI